MQKKKSGVCERENDSERKRNRDSERAGENYNFVIIVSFIYIFKI